MRTNRVCPMYGKAGNSSQGSSQGNVNMENEDAQHSFDLAALDTSASTSVADVSVKMVEGGGTKLIFAKNVLEKSVDSFLRWRDELFSLTRAEQGNKPARKSKKLKGSKSLLPTTGLDSMAAGDESTNDSQSMPIGPPPDTDRPPTPPPIVHVSKMPFIPPMKSSSSSSPPPVNLSYTPKSSGTLKTTLSHTGHRRKSSTTPTGAGSKCRGL